MPLAGTAAVGIMLLDKAKNLEPRSLKDAFMAGLACVPKVILYLLLLVALFIALFVVAAILYYVCKIPFIGPVLLFFVHPALVVYVFKNKTKKNRVGITTSKKIGKAVQRNRARRVIRAAYMENCDLLQNGYDFVFVARGKTPFVKSTDLAKVMKKLLEKANVLK